MHAELGYVRDKMTVIPNGFDLEVFKPDPASRLSVRRELGLPEDAVLVGLVARFDRQKDHRNFVHAAGKVAAEYPGARFLLCGSGVTAENRELDGWLRAAGVRDRCHLLGQREDVPRLMAALDVAVSSSLGEAFPLVVGEAMSCGVPCVVTDVGDSALIVGDTGKVVPSEDFAALACGIGELLEAGAERRSLLGEAARRRIGEHVSLPDMVAAYERLYREIVLH
ncbi:MAG: N-acetyl-alpha-D-glucosaminyl L-malate synthase [Syntrophomonadaceae bacterium]|nr:N-acetyl-alpha-D-glucosaminyl L-malate synthase [Bacillota bacterium]